MKTRDTRMKFTVVGSKSYPSNSYVNETDLLTLPTKNIKLRQRRLNKKILSCVSWESIDVSGKKYTKSVITLWGVYAN